MNFVTVITPDELDGNGTITTRGGVLHWDFYERHYLAEGDSWFSAGDFLSLGFLYQFGHRVPLKKDTLIVNCASPGDTLEKMIDWTKNRAVPKLLSTKGFCWKWDAILLSAGGNDIIEAAQAPAGILRACATPTTYRDFIVDEALARLEDHLKQYFLYLVQLRNASAIPENRDRPIFLHTYGYPTARNAPAMKGYRGPWLYKAFNDKNIPPQYWADLSKALMDALAQMLRNFSQLGSNIRLVDTLTNVALTPARADDTGNSGDWVNEIHLNDSGKDKIARYWAKALQP